MAKPKAQPTKGRHFVRERRELRGLTQEELAALIGRSRPLITQIEGGTTDLTGGTIFALADALGCSPGSLFRDPSTDPIVAAINDELEKHPELQSEALGYIRGRTAEKPPKGRAPKT